MSKVSTVSTVCVLARYVCSLKATDISRADKHRAAMCILDTLAAAAAGLYAPTVVAAREATIDLFGKGDVPIWFDGRRTTAAGAIFANSSASAALDMDDGQIEAWGHPGAAVIPAALALASEIGASADDALAAIVVGYEVGTRIKAARGSHGQPAEHGQTGVWTGFCVAAATGWLLKVSADQLANGLALSGVYSPNLIATGYTSQFGGDVKEGLPWSTVAGYSSLVLGKLGHIGFADIFDHLPFYNSRRILRGLGEDEMKINGNYFKPYATCRHFHGSLKALETLIAEHAIKPNEITAIRVNIFEYALKLSNKTRPDNLADIQYSIPFCTAVMAMLGPDSLMPIDESLIGREDICALAEKVEIVVNPEFSAQHAYAYQHLPQPDEGSHPDFEFNSVDVVTTHGTYSSPVVSPPYNPDAPMSMEELEHKFRTATRSVLNHSQQEDLLNAFARLLDGEIAPLLEVTARPAAR
ncbi:MmgE/PrpD family protein [Paraburkholderia caribensis]|uniref:MmgE/PrpD family protein n=2 Tax=Paraburkholderia TaxID=1822464 RepID=B2JXT0_PARP8|nr:MULTISPECIES: MmgE/PrpD family protein [Paraburkholderia]ACC76438.1 MmgE/PrpD family protein [Paraburkholderia phymatum STM815]MCO4879399.1 MmgE/PrpD family protein [Paraburkholderia caribensis]PTB24559.1 MmgE/PrpD family protein [Paraburkholderia caribensis]